MYPQDYYSPERQPNAAEKTARQRWFNKVIPGTVNIARVQDMRQHAKALRTQPVQATTEVARTIVRNNIDTGRTPDNVVQMADYEHLRKVSEPKIDTDSNETPDNVVQMSDYEASARSKLAEAQVEGVKYKNPNELIR